jgi:hypothetical protein
MSLNPMLNPRIVNYSLKINDGIQHDEDSFVVWYSHVMPEATCGASFNLAC